MSEELTNGKIMEILESIAKEWSIDKSDEQIDTVVDYMNTTCAKWMGGNWGLKLEHIKSNKYTELIEKHGSLDDFISAIETAFDDGLCTWEEKEKTINEYRRELFNAKFSDKPTEGNK